MSRVRVRFRGRFSCQLIIDSRMPVHDPRGSGSGYRFTIHDHYIPTSVPLVVRDAGAESILTESVVGQFQRPQIVDQTVAAL